MSLAPSLVDMFMAQSIRGTTEKETSLFVAQTTCFPVAVEKLLASPLTKGYTTGTTSTMATPMNPYNPRMIKDKIK